MLRLILVTGAILSGGGVSACPAAGPGGAQIDLSGAPAGVAHRAQVIAGGSRSLAGCAHVPEGHFRSEPDFSVIAAGGTGALEFRSEGECDTMLLVAAADGSWHFDDDGAGAGQARITIPSPVANRYDVWVGSFTRGSCRAQLVVGEGIG